MSNVANKDSLLNAIGTIFLPVAKSLAKLDARLQMQVEGLPYVDFEFDFDNGDLVMEYIDGVSIVEDNFNFADGDLIITPTA